jgi:anti-sigma factor RsiW
MNADIHTLSGAYALNAVNDLERVAFDRHLAECDVCAEEVAGLIAAAASMTDATWSVAPPGLRDRVLREVSNTAQVRPESGRRAAGAGMASRRWRTWAVSAAAAVVLVAGAAAAAALVQQGRVRHEQDLVAAAQRRQAAIEQVLGATDVKVNREAVAGGGSLAVAVSEQQNAAVTTLSGLRAPVPNRCYTVWRMQDGNPVRAGLFTEGEASGLLVIGDVRGSQLVAVTEESCAAPPDKPTMDPIAAVAIA